MRSRWLLLVGVLAVTACRDRKTEQTNDPPPQGPEPAPAPATGPVRGTVGGQRFTPDEVIVEGRTLSFRQGKEFFADREIKFDLPDGPLEDKEWTFQGNRFENPTVWAAMKEGQGVPRTEFNQPGDYTMTLRITRQTARELAGAIDLRANKPAGTVLSGTFSAVRKKTTDDALDADDAPYVQGKIMFVGPWSEEKLAAGFVGKGADGKEHSNLAGTSVSPTGGGWATSRTFEPQLTSLMGDRKGGVGYRHTRLPPGEYLVYVKRDGVMAAWRKAVVKVGDQLTLDLTIDSSKTGEVVVTLPDAEANEKLESPLSLRSINLDVPVNPVSFAFDAAEVKAGQTTVTVKGVPAGKYRAVRGKSAADVEVVAGKSVVVTLVRADPKK